MYRISKSYGNIYDLQLKGITNLYEVRSLIVQTVSNIPRILADPNAEALLLDLSDVESNAMKVKVLWWTTAPASTRCRPPSTKS